MKREYFEEFIDSRRETWEGHPIASQIKRLLSAVVWDCDRAFDLVQRLNTDEFKPPQLTFSHALRHPVHIPRITRITSNPGLADSAERRRISTFFHNSTLQKHLILGGNLGRFSKAHWSPDGSTALTTGQGFATLWDAQSGECIRVLSPPTSDGRATCGAASWSPDGSSILTASTRGPVIVWSTKTGIALAEVGSTPGWEQILSLQWTADGLRLLTSDKTSQVSLWNASTGTRLLQIQWTDDMSRRSGIRASISSDCSLLLTQDYRMCRLWSIRSGVQIAQAKMELPQGHWNEVDHEYRTESFTWSPDGSCILFSGSSTRIWDSPFTSQPRTIDTQGHSHATHLSPDGSRILTLGETAVRILDVVSGKQVVKLDAAGVARRPADWQYGRFDQVAEVTHSAIWAPDGSCVLMVGWDSRREGLLRVYDSHSGVELAAVKHPGAPWSMRHCAWSPDGTKILTVGSDSKARIWTLKPKAWSRSAANVRTGL